MSDKKLAYVNCIKGQHYGPSTPEEAAKAAKSGLKPSKIAGVITASMGDSSPHGDFTRFYGRFRCETHRGELIESPELILPGRAEKYVQGLVESAERTGSMPQKIRVSIWCDPDADTPTRYGWRHSTPEQDALEVPAW